MAADVVPYESPEGEDIGLTHRQVAALEQLHTLGAGPKLPTDEKYHSNPQIRALQMVYEGKLGGPGRGQGRPGREQRISVQLTDYVRQNLGKKVTKALERALKADAGERVNLDAIRLIVEVENREAKLQLSEDAADLDGQTKEQLLATLYELVNDPATGQVITATFTDLPTPEQTVLENDRRAYEAEARRSARTKRQRRRATASAPVAESRQRNGDSSRPRSNGTDTPSAGEDRRGDAALNRPAHPNPVTQAALRRSANRR